MRLKALFVAFVLLGSTSSDAAQTERKFAKDMLTRFRKVSPGGEMRIKADEPLVIQIKSSAGWDEAMVNLHRIWSFCQNNPLKECERLKQEFVQKVGSGTPERGTKATLRVIVRDSEYMDDVFQTFQDRAKLPIHKSIGEGLFTILAFDSKDTIALANSDGLKDVGLAEEEAWKVALAQTKAILPKIPAEKIGAQQAIAFQDMDYLASLMADTEEWTSLAKKAGPDLAVSVVSDGFVFVLFIPDGPKLSKFKETVREDCLSQQRCVSPHVYRFRDGQWRIAR